MSDKNRWKNTGESQSLPVEAHALIEMGMLRAAKEHLERRGLLYVVPSDTSQMRLYVQVWPSCMEELNGPGYRPCIALKTISSDTYIICQQIGGPLDGVYTTIPPNAKDGDNLTHSVDFEALFIVTLTAILANDPERLEAY